MENKIHGYVYLITNLINGKQYVGQTVETIEIRFGNHCSSKNPVISRAIRKYGKKNFKVEEIDVAYNQEELNLIEGVYMAWFNTLTPNGYNIKKIIDGKGRHSKESIEKMRKSINTPERLELSYKIHRGKTVKKSRFEYVGVYRAKKKYGSCIGFNGKTIYLGNYNNKIDAAKAYDIAAIKYFGNNAILNFPELRKDYINGKIIVNKNTQQDSSKSGIKGVHFDKSRNKWRFRYFDKILNKYKSKDFETLEDIISFKNLQAG